MIVTRTIKWKNFISTALATSTLVASGAVTPVAAAQSTVADASDSVSLEEIVVTARRREEFLQRTPVAVTAFGAQALEERSIGDIWDIAGYTPNVEFTPGSITGNSGGHIFIRGIGQSDFLITTDPGVGVYVDGVYLGRTQGGLLDLLDFERIEVLRGPQGTLFGKNTIGGAVNIVSARPRGEFGGVAEVTTGRFNRIDGRFTIEFPIAEDKLSGRIAVLSKNRDGYGKSVDFTTGETLNELGDDNTLAARGALLWTPDENIDVLLAIDGTRAREEGPVQSMVEFITPDPADPASLINLYNFVAVPVLGVPPFDGRYIPDNPFINFENGRAASRNDLDNWGVSATVDWDLGGQKLRSVTAYRNLENRTGAGDATPAEIILQRDNLKQDQFSQEIQLSGLSFNSRLNWITGAIYYTENAENHTIVAQIPALNPVFAMLGIPVELGRDDIHKNKTESMAFYAQGTYALTERLSFTLGGRYTYEKKKYTPNFRTLSLVTIIPRQTLDKSWNVFTPKFGMEFQANDDILTYVSVARGFRSGGFNGRAGNVVSLAGFDPEFVWTYELGLKSRWFADRLQINAAAFYNDYTDIQLLLVNATPTGFNVTTENAASAKVTGFELEMLARPIAGLDLSASVGYMDSKIKGPPPGSGVAGGARLMETPEWSLSLGAQYRMPAGDLGALTLRVDYNYRSRTFHDVKNTPSIAQKGFGLLNMRLTFETTDSGWQLALFGTNLTDERYKTTGIEALGFANFAVAQWGRPREWGLSLKYSF
jgi:iron complex outermembrane receptor protein